MRRDRWGKVIIEPGDWVTFAPKVTQAAIDALHLSERVIAKLRGHRLIAVEENIMEKLETRGMEDIFSDSSDTEGIQEVIPQGEREHWMLWDLDKFEPCGTIPAKMIVPVTEPGEKVLLLGDD